VAVSGPAKPARAGAEGAEDSSVEGVPDRESGRLGVCRRKDPRCPANAAAQVAAGGGCDRERRSKHCAARVRSNKPAWVMLGTIVLGTPRGALVNEDHR
jgi:hypothetical protein